MEYSYIKLPSNPASIERPLVKIDLIFPKMVLSTYALVDSGADCCQFDLELARIAGMKANDFTKIRAQGAGGAYSCFQMPIKIGFQNKVILLKNATWAPATDSKTGMINSFNLLGREDFFKHFDILFSQNKKKFWID